MTAVAPTTSPRRPRTPSSTQTPDQQVEDAGSEPAEQPAPEEAARPGRLRRRLGGGGGGGGEGTSVTMPALGESVTEGTVTRWLKAVGDEVTADEPLLEVSTDKVDTEIPSPVSGTLLSIAVNEDETVDVGAELAVIGTAGGAASAAARHRSRRHRSRRPPQQEEAPAEPQAAPEAKPAAPAAATAQPGGDYGASGAQPASSPTSAPAPQVAPQAAAAAPAGDGAAPTSPRWSGGWPPIAGVDLEQRLRHRRRRSDPQAGRAGRSREAAPAAPAAAAASAPATRTPSPAAMPDTSVRGRTEKLSRLRAVIARRMVESLQVSAQLTTVVEADVTRIAKLRQQAKADFEAREGVKLSFLPFFAKAAVEALKAHPSVNSSIDQEAGTVTYHDTENLGVAVDTERGLLVPVIHEAGDLSLGGFARKIADLADRTRTNKITPDELGGGTFTLTNTGSRGALFDTPIINQPQVAILGVGSVVKRPVVVQDPELGEVIAIRSMVYLALTYDHRIVDGADAARFLTTVRERLEAGQFQGELGLA